MTVTLKAMVVAMKEGRSPILSCQAGEHGKSRQLRFASLFSSFFGFFLGGQNCLSLYH